MTGQDKAQTCTEQESGMVVIAMLAVTLPLLVLVSAASLTMDQRSKAQLAEVNNYKAFLAAESGIDELLYRARTSELVLDDEFELTLASGNNAVVRTIPEGDDNIDNDKDGQIDEKDEDILMVTVTGTFKNAMKRLSVRLRANRGALPLNLNAALTLTGSTTIDMNGNAGVHGGGKGFGVAVYDPSSKAGGGGGPGGPEPESPTSVRYDIDQLIAQNPTAPFLPNLQAASSLLTDAMLAIGNGDDVTATTSVQNAKKAIGDAMWNGFDAATGEALKTRIQALKTAARTESLAMLAGIESELSRKSTTNIQGLGGTGADAMGVTAQDPQLDEMVEMANDAGEVLTAGSYSSGSFGDLNDTKAYYRNGDVHFSGTTNGAGILVVTGTLRVTGQFNWKGIVIVLGAFEGAGQANIEGGMVLGPKATYWARGNDDIKYNPDYVQNMLISAGKKSYVTFDGWQEIGRYTQVAPAKAGSGSMSNTDSGTTTGPTDGGVVTEPK